MARIVAETVCIEISRIAKDGDQLKTVINSEMVTTLEAVVQELVGDSAVVEINLASDQE